MPSSPIRFEPCARGDIGAYAAYLSSLSSPIDSFLEDHILASGFQRISQGGRELGFFATHPTGLLTQFHLIPDAWRRAQAAYADILNAIRPTAAIVPTCDEFFLSHALDACSAVRKQAYFFTAIPGDDAAAGIRA